NSPYGACPTCNGIGFYKKIDEDLVIPNKELSINEGGIVPYSNSGESTYYHQIIKTLAEDNGFDLDTPLKYAPKKFMDELLYGTDREITFKFNSHFSGGVKT